MDEQADTVVILSSELIEEIIEQYFNRTMFKGKVKVVESKPTEAGYMFSVQLVKKGDVELVLYGQNGSNTGLTSEEQELALAGSKAIEYNLHIPSVGMLPELVRDSKGRFVPKER